MTRFNGVSNFRQSIVVGLSLLCFMVLSVGPTQAAMEGLRGAANSTLDTIEQLVIDSGLPDLKKRVYEEKKLLIKPFLKTRYTLTDNVFKAPDTDSDHTDNLWSFIPGFQWVYKSSLGVIGGAYEAAFNYFSQFSQQNQQDQKFLVYANLFPTEKTYIRASERMVQEGSVAGSSAFEPIDFLDNEATVVAGYIANEKWTFELGYQNFDRDFSNSVAERYNYNEDKWDYRAYYQLTKLVRVYSGARIAWVDFSRDGSRDTFYHEIPIGVEGKLPYGLTLLGSVGFHHRNLEDSSRNDLTHVVTNISLAKKMNYNRTAVHGGFLRRPVESSFSTATTYDEKLWYASLKHLLTPRLRGRLDVYVGNRDFEERVFTGTRLIIGGAVFVTPPDQVKRDDDVFGFTMGFDYNVRKWLVTHIDYQYSRRDSNISALDYTENVFSLGTTMPL